LLIDDALENAISVVKAASPTPVLLFGQYEWNRRLSQPGDNNDQMSFDTRFKVEGGRKFWQDEKVELPEDLPLWRVDDWNMVVKWIEEQLQESN
jgi:hypothetical protein